jgi:DNA-binding SARP family transcriptional activator
MIRWQLRLLGSFELVLAGEPAAGSGPEKSIRAKKSFRSQSERALLAYLACEAGRPHSREALAGLLWPELPAETAHNNLRVTLHRLRQVLGDPDAAHPLLHVSRDAIQLVQAGQLWVDVTAFQELLTRVEQHPHENLAACAACLVGYAEAAVLYQGDFLQGLYPAESLPFAEWALLKREHLHRQALRALYLLAAYHQRMGELDQALGYARRQLELEPWREEAHCQVMTLLALQGDAVQPCASMSAAASYCRRSLGLSRQRKRVLFTSASSPRANGTGFTCPNKTPPSWEER